MPEQLAGHVALAVMPGELQLDTGQWHCSGAQQPGGVAAAGKAGPTG